MNFRKYSGRNGFFFFILMSAGAFSTLMIFLVCRYFNLHLLFAPVLILTVFYLVGYLSIEKKNQILKYLLFGSALFLAIHFFYTISKSYSRIPEWDYIAFYLYSLAGQSGGNFYDPELFREIFNSYKLTTLTSPVFFEEVVEVGFPYPPPTMIMLFPLGWFDLETGYFIWQSILIIFLIAGFCLLLDIFSFKRNERGEKKILLTLVIVHLILLFPGITSSFSYAQTNPILLFFLLLTLKRMHHWDAGIYLVIMIVIKPLAVLFAFYFLMKRRWNVIAAATVSGVIVLIITGVIFDFNVFVQYFVSPPTDRLPEFVYSETINKSLSAVLLRLHSSYPAFADQTVIKPLIIAISSILLLFTVLLSWRLAGKSSRLSFLIFIPFGLLVYPASLAHYSLLLIPVILVFREQYHSFERPVFLFLLITIYIVAGINMFYLNILLLSYFAYLSVKLKTGDHIVDLNKPLSSGRGHVVAGVCPEGIFDKIPDAK